MQKLLPTEELRYDMSQFYPLKAALEGLLGHGTYMRLKETGTLRDWKQEVNKLLRAIRIAVESTVAIADDEWFAEIDSILELGKSHIASSITVTELFAHLSATLTKLVFLQIGFLPLGGQTKGAVPLTKQWWTLDPVRTVQYVQNGNQRRTAQGRRDKRAKAQS